MPYEPRWPESPGEQTDVLPVVRPEPDPARTAAQKLAGRIDPRKAGLIAGGALGLLVAIYGIDLLVSQGSVPRGVTVAGVDVGGMDRQAAEQELRGRIEPRLTRPLAVTAGDVQGTLSPTAAGLKLDWPQTLDQAGEQPLNPFTRLASLFSGREVGVVSHADDAKLAAALESLRGQVDRDPAEGTVRFDGTTPVAVAPKPGQKLDVEAAKAAVVEKWAGGETLALPVTSTPVSTTPEGVQAALEQFARPAVSGPLVVKGDGKNATVQPDAIAAALSFEPADGGGLTPKIDNGKIAEAAGPQLKSTEKEGKDADDRLRGRQAGGRALRGRPRPSTGTRASSRCLTDLLPHRTIASRHRHVRQAAGQGHHRAGQPARRQGGRRRVHHRRLRRRLRRQHPGGRREGQRRRS